jgi:hypothetical protein
VFARGLLAMAFVLDKATDPVNIIDAHETINPMLIRNARFI